MGAIMDALVIKNKAERLESSIIVREAKVAAAYSLPEGERLGDRLQVAIDTDRIKLKALWRKYKQLTS